jgi:hypothetical protein
MISQDQIKVAGTNYLHHKSLRENAKNDKELHAQSMVTAIYRSTLNSFRASLRADLHNADTQSQLQAEEIEVADWHNKTGRAYEKYDAYCKQINEIIPLLEIVETYLDGREPEKPAFEEYIKIKYDGRRFWCQRCAMARNGQPTDKDEPVSGYAKFEQPSVTKLVAALRASGRLQPAYIQLAGRFRKVG